MIIAALDIGGTAVKYCRYDDRLPFDRGLVRETPTEADKGGEAVLARALALLEQLRPFDAAAVSSAGQIDPRDGRVIYATGNIPGYTGLPLGERIHSRFGVPVVVENDVNAAALGEAAEGAGRGCRDFVCLTFGTGIGGAIVQDGRLLYGSSFSAAEAGHMLIHAGGRRCTCGNRGCYEAYASTTALVRLAGEATGIAGLSGRRIFEKLDADPRLRAAVEGWMQEILWGLVSLTHLLNPSRIVLGGGIMNEPLIPAWLREHIGAYLMESYRHVEIVPAELGNTAGLRGVIRRAQAAHTKGWDSYSGQ